MAKAPPKLDGVKMALDDLISLEQERIRKEEAARLAREQEETRRRKEQELKRKEEEEMRKKEQEEERRAREKVEREEAEKREWQKQLEQSRLKQELEMKQRLEEERMRLRHEQQLKEIETRGRRNLPKWPVAAALAFLVAGGAAAGIVLYKMKRNAEDMEKERIAAIEAARSKERQSGLKIAQLQELLAEMEKKVDITKEETAKMKEIKDQIAALQASQPGRGKPGKPGKPAASQGAGAGQEEQDEFVTGPDPLAGIEKDLGSTGKSPKKKKKRIKTINTKGGTFNLEDPLQEL
jgi:hypothetical protein